MGVGLGAFGCLVKKRGSSRSQSPTSASPRALQMRATSLVYKLTLRRLRVRLGAVGKKPEAAQGGDLGCPWLDRAPGRQKISLLSWDPVAKGGPASGRALSPCFARDRTATPPGSGAGHHAADRAPRAAGPRAGEGRAGGRAPWRWARLGVSSGASGRWADGALWRARRGLGWRRGRGRGRARQHRRGGCGRRGGGGGGAGLPGRLVGQGPAPGTNGKLVSVD